MRLARSSGSLQRPGLQRFPSSLGEPWWPSHFSAHACAGGGGCGAQAGLEHAICLVRSSRRKMRQLLAERSKKQARRNSLFDFCTYFQARMSVFVFVTFSYRKGLNACTHLTHKETRDCVSVATTPCPTIWLTKACCFAIKRKQLPYHVHTIPYRVAAPTAACAKPWPQSRGATFVEF